MHRLLLLLVLLAAVACRPAGAPLAFSATVPDTGVHVAASSPVTLVPTLNRGPSQTPVPVSTVTPTPGPTLTPSITPSPTPNMTAVPISSPTGPAVDANGTPLPTWTPPPDDPATRIDDHYRMRRPISQDYTNWVDRSYPYGSTQGGRLQTHLGVEFYNARGTPVLAVADGTVVHAGDDMAAMYGPITNYYGRLIVIQHDFTAPDGQPVFSLYGHLSRWDVETGERVTTGQPIGLVGDTGVALGPHLHLEVRVGEPTNFGVTRNPELWVYPFGGFGTLVGRVTDANGALLYSAPIQVRSRSLVRNTTSYADDSVNPDPVFGENFTLGDLPANYYDVSVTADGRVRFQKTIYVYPNRSTWIDIQLN